MKTTERKDWIELPADFDFEKYEAQGVDISLLTATLRMTPTERAQNNKALIGLWEEAQKHLNKKPYAHA